MKRTGKTSKLAMSALALGTALAIGVAVSPALSHGWGNESGGQPGVQGNAPQGFGQMMGGQGFGGQGFGGPGFGGQGFGGQGFGGGMMSPNMMRMMQSQGGFGPTGGFGPMGGFGGMNAGFMGGAGQAGIFQALTADADTNGDGAISPQELQTALSAKLKQYDTDGDGSLSLDEFAKLHADLVRAQTVDSFQALDEDGNGKVTAEEFSAPARQFEQMMQLRDKAKSWQNGSGNANPSPKGSPADMMGGAPQPGQATPDTNTMMNNNN